MGRQEEKKRNIADSIDGVFADPEAKRLPLRVLVFWEIVVLCTAALLLGLVLWILKPHTILWYLLLVLLGGAYLFYAVFYFPMYYVGFRLYHHKNFIASRSGVIVEKTRYQRKEEITVVEVYDNLLTPLCGLSTLMLHSPGSTLFILLMDSKEAHALARTLSLPGRVTKKTP